MKNFRHKSPKLELVNRSEFIIDSVRDKVVLHLGAVDNYKGSIAKLHKTLMTISKGVVGLDLDKDGIEKIKKEGIYNIFYSNVEDIDIFLEDRFDIILAGEIIEHLSNAGLFLDNIKRFFSTETKMIITTPNAFCLELYIHAFLGTENVHIQHTCYYSYHTLKELLERHGFTIEKSYYYVGSKIGKIAYKIFPSLSTGLIFIVSYKEKRI